MNTVTVQPTGKNVLIEPMLADDTSVGGIFIPDGFKEKPQQGFVAALGTGQHSAKGVLIPWDVKVGDRVLLRKFHGTDIRVADKIYKMVTAEDLLAVLVDEPQIKTGCANC